jgi:hypothetical protein
MSFVGAAHGAPAEERSASEQRMAVAQRDHALGEAEQGSRFVVQIPVHPRQLVVLAIGVVVAPLRAAEFVAMQQHRDALGEEQRRDEVAHLPQAQRADRRVVGRPLDAAVPAAIVRFAVGIALAVRLVCLSL